jgi:hypothetical protein
MEKSSRPKPDTGDDDCAAILARSYLRPTLQAAATIQAWNKGKVDDGLRLPALIAELGEQVAAVNSGDLRRAEALLITQAHTLDTIFGNLARRACKQEYLRQYETYMRLALKAQSQCRATVHALADMKNPRPVAFVQQANIASGPQQVNNGTTRPNGIACAGKCENAQSKLLDATDGKRLDARAQGSPGDIDTEMAAVGAIDRAAQRGGQSNG